MTIKSLPLLFLCLLSCKTSSKKDEKTTIKKEQVVKNHINLDSIRHLICNKNWRSDYFFDETRVVDSSKIDVNINVEARSKNKNINQLSDEEKQGFIFFNNCDSCDTDSIYYKSTYKPITDYEFIMYDSPVIHSRDTWKVINIDSKIYIDYGRIPLLQEIVFLNEETLIIVPSSTDGFRVYTNDSIPYHQSKIEEDEYFIIPLMRKYYKERGFNLVKMDLDSTGK